MARELHKSLNAPDAPAPFKRLRAAVARFPGDVRAEVHVGKFEMLVESGELRHEQPLRELVTMRAELIRVGGIRPAVRLRSDERDFSLEADKVTLRALGGYLYREIEFEAEVERDELGNIVDGRMTNYAVVGDDDPVDAWQRWFDENAADWNEESVEAVLGRNRD